MKKLIGCLLVVLLLLTGCGGGGSSSSSPQLTLISLSPAATSSIVNGLTQQYTATAIYSDGTTSILSSGVDWTSSNTAVATINSNGLATVIANSGSTSITANYLNITSSPATLNATAAAVTSTTIAPLTSVIADGRSQQYLATVTYTDGVTSPITSGITWSSSNTNVATINNNGLAKVKSTSGSTTITAVYNNISSESTTLSATAAVVTSISLTPIASIIVNGRTQQYLASATYSDGTTSFITSEVIWKSSNTAIATIDNNGLATVHANSGATIITATYGNIISRPATLNASAAVVTTVYITPLTSILANGLSQQYLVMAAYSDGTKSPLTTGVIWTSSNTTVATIDNTGLATVHANTGTSLITASYGSITSSLPATLIATAAIVESISITPTSSSIENRLDQQYSAFANYSDGTSSALTYGLTWKSSNINVATININTGLAQVVADGGTTYITAQFGNKTSNIATLYAYNSPIMYIFISPTNDVTIPKGSGQQFSATAVYGDGANSIITSGLTWNSQNTNVAVIDNQGYAQAASPTVTGLSVISVTYGPFEESYTILTIQ